MIRGLDAWLTREPDEGPALVGPLRLVRSKERHQCQSCYDWIEAGTPHHMQALLGEEGMFVGVCRTHVLGQCRPDPEDVW